ncbi:hypothetical protein F511_28193 [Dorcoceras hygrometricum]|uniref:C2H2-type domain-containing protein n=1 Tax=Dorcoceras hygrometricum TaxID=472368 RepID=A0A2Z7B704_9LAMI|nr:hypothetical protein F511_28193 [Dorcoceras hygrometricum]
MAKFPLFVANFFSCLVLLLHLGCFFTVPRRHHRRRSNSSSFSSFKKKLTPSSKSRLASLLRRLFFLPPSSDQMHHPSSIPSPSSSTRSLRLNPPAIVFPMEENSSTPFLPSDDIFPCTICGEIFQKLYLLEQHQSVKHAVSELVDGENIVRIIFKTGWPEKGKPPTIHRILKIHNTSKILTKFEEYREYVKSKAAAKIKPSRDERCVADGNELLRFHCTTFMCELSDSTICNHQYCCVCGIIRCGFSSKMDGISTFPTSWTAHTAVPEDIEEEFGFMNVRRALLVCRVVAGRVGCDPGIVDKEDSGFDSLVGRGSGGFEEELLVFNPRAVLPCFVIVYTA